MDDFDCTTAGRAIAEFVEELSNWYVRLSRRRFWDGDRAAFATLRTCLLETTKMLAPFTPFLADEIYRNLAGGADGDFGEAPDSVHLARLPRGRRRAPRPDAGSGDGRGAAHRPPRPRRPLRRQGESAPAAAPRGDRRQRGRAGGDRGARRPGHRRAEREGARLRLRGGRPRHLRGQAELPRPRAALRQEHAAGGGGGGGARPGPRGEPR